METVQVDGAEGEGGGQILRTAVAFAVIKGRPVHVVKIRAGRPEPGLKRQHLSALEVLAKVFDGNLEGAREGSTEITFTPGKARTRSLSLNMGTAASITLLLQAVVPAVSLTGERLGLELVGGTDVPWSPTFDYFERVVRSAFKSIGLTFEVRADRRGYYPRGGGKVTANIAPCHYVSPMGLAGRGAADADVVSRCGGLPMHVAERQLTSASRILQGAGLKINGLDAVDAPSDSPGSSILVSHVGGGTFLGADAIGARGKPAEEVGAEAATKFAREAATGAQLDSNLGDMLIPLLSLSPEPSTIAVPAVTPHLMSGLGLAEKFTGCAWKASKADSAFVVRIEPRPGG